MLITAVTQQKKNENRLSVYIDNKFAFGITRVDALYYHIKEGEEISPERYNNILEELIYAKARDKAIKLLGFSLRTEKELLQKLGEEYSVEICTRVIDMLKGYGYIDDEEYAKAYINDSYNYKGWGSRKIKVQLKNKGIAEEKIEKALDEAVFDEVEKAYSLLKKRLKGNTTLDYKERAKHYRYLASRGFDYDIINSAFLKLAEEDLED